MTENTEPFNADAMVIARAIVEAHNNTWGQIPHWNYLQESIAASLGKAARTGTLKWTKAADGDEQSADPDKGLPTAEDVRGILKDYR